jgi:hypothetical protein
MMKGSLNVLFLVAIITISLLYYIFVSNSLNKKYGKYY